MVKISPPFKRTQVTWLSYLMLGYFAYIPSAFGPLMPFLRADLSLSYAQGGLHLTAFSVGMSLTGLFGSRLSQRWGRLAVLWGGAAGIALGALSLGAAPGLWLSLPSAFLMGVSGSSIQMVVQAVLSDQHGPQRTTALSEANIVASFSPILAPLLVSGFQRVGLSWRLALFCVPLLLIGLAAAFRKVSLPRPGEPGGAALASPSARLPWLFWAYWFCLLLFVAVEWCLGVWSADFMVSAWGLRKVDAILIMGLYVGAAVAGRFSASRLTRRYPPQHLLGLALGLCLLGFPLFWLVPWRVIAVLGLLLANLGVANLFPLAMILAVSAAPQQPDLASGRTLLAAGLAGMSAPLALGWLADQFGIYRAFGFVMGMLLLALGVLWGVRRLPQKGSAV